MCDSYNAFRFAIDGTVNIDGPKSGGLCSYDNYQITSDFNSLCIGKELLLLISVRRLYKLAVVYRSTFSRATTAMEMSHYYQFKRLLRLWLVEYCMTTTDLFYYYFFNFLHSQIHVFDFSQPRIVGGMDTTIYKYPFQTVIYNSLTKTTSCMGMIGVCCAIEFVIRSNQI